MENRTTFPKAAVISLCFFVFFIAVSCAHSGTGARTVLVPSGMPLKAALNANGETSTVAFRKPIRLEGLYASVDFEEAAIPEIISEFDGALKQRFRLEPCVKGKMTIQSLGWVPADALAGIFRSVLEANGLKTVRSGQVVDIAPREAVPGKVVTFDGHLINEVIPLHHVSWKDAVTAIRELAPPKARVEIYEPDNLIIVSARAPELQKFIEMVRAVDTSSQEKAARLNWVYRVENGEAGRLAAVIKKVFRPGPSEGGKEAFELTSYSDINALVARCTPDTYLRLLRLLMGLDVPPRQVLIDVLVAQVQLTDSTQLGLEWLLKQTGTNFTVVGGFNQGSVGIGPDGEPFANLAQGFSTALTGKVDSLALAAALSSLAQENRVSVLASPQILAMDGKRARIEIGSELPVATGFFQQPSTAISNTLVSAGQIRYKSVGTILSVLPHITDRNMVTLDIEQEVSEAGQPVPVAGQNFQGFNTRRAYTTASVGNGETLLIGGLISENKNYTRAGIPLLSKIPILGYLFSVTKATTDRTELIVMVTPHIVSNTEEAEEITRRFENRVGLVRKAIAQGRKDP